MKAKASDWYQKNWTLDIKQMSWVEHTVEEVDYLISLCRLKGIERILDLVCGYGRHALEFAKRGYEVVGVNITELYIEDAKKSAREMGLSRALFVCSDIRDVDFCEEFDVVLNLADDAMGYLENEEENDKVFDVISKALKKGGQHVCDLVNGSYAQAHFPVKLWEAGEHSLSLSEFDWDPDTHIMMFGNQDFAYGEPVTKPEIAEGDPTRVYTLAELADKMEKETWKCLPDIQKRLQAARHSRCWYIVERKRVQNERGDTKTIWGLGGNAHMVLFAGGHG